MSKILDRYLKEVSKYFYYPKGYSAEEVLAILNGVKKQLATPPKSPIRKSK